MHFTYYEQLNAMDCGPTCVRMIAQYYGRHYSGDTLRQKAGFGKSGVSLLGISDTAEKIGLRSRGAMITYEQLKAAGLPCILHWNQNHFVVLISFQKRGRVEIADPAKGILTYKKDEFLNHWISRASLPEESQGDKGIVLLLEPTPSFYEHQGDKKKPLSWSLILQYLKNSKWQILQVIIALFFSSVVQLLFPFLTQTIVDTGINAHNLEYITIILIAQLMLTFSKTIVDFIRSRLLLRISNILNMQILSDFWIKVTRLPLSYFEAHQTGDTLQRINDNRQIQNFLTGSALDTFFSVFNFAVYAIVLIIYNVQLFFIFLIGTAIYFGWILFFLKIRRKINYQTFYFSSKENNATLQLIQGMQEIRLNNAEKQKRWDWENIQASVFRLNFKNLNYNQWQQAGATLINNIQDIAITFIVARLVIDGQLTIGAMLAVQYIIGQLSGPVNQWVGFVQNAQDAKISMERLNEIHQMNDEEGSEKIYHNYLPKNKSIFLKSVSFTYPGAGNEPVLQNINLRIPQGKVTAIVGTSGSGKTTLLKLLLKIYQQYEGEVKLGTDYDDNCYTNDESDNTLSFSGNGFDIQEQLLQTVSYKTRTGIPFENISSSYWRKVCGAVMQEGYIFNDTIARNIAVGEENIEYNNLLNSCEIANILPFIEGLPNGFYTELGTQGVGLSLGQKQRLLIARAVYKNPEYLFFDEATNSLDANNEKEIVEKLDHFFMGKTVIVVAHRLSTVRNADKIVVLDKGRIVEEGSHEQLTRLRGKYYDLVKNQLELGKN